VDHEFRTTCHPDAVTPADLVTIASGLAGGRRYALQQFRPAEVRDPAAARVTPYAPDVLARAAEACSAHLPTVVRGAA
jgi:hypothetical protein